MNQLLLNKALNFATDVHKDQKYDNKPYIIHPILVAQVIEFLQPNDINLISAGYLHDILEDSNYHYEDIKRLFNKDIADLVLEVTKTDYNTFPNLKTRRGVILKLADRLCNMVHISKWSEEEQQKYIEKTKFWKI